MSWEVDETEVWDGATMYSYRDVGGRRFLSEGFSHVLYDGKLRSMSAEYECEKSEDQTTKQDVWRENFTVQRGAEK